MRFAIIVLGAIVSFIASLQAGENSVAVTYGGEVDLDACAGWGEVSGLNPKGDNWLAVRSGPSVGYQMIDKLHPKQNVWLCDRRGNWYGIVYSKSHPKGDCGVTSPVARLQKYPGPCRAGWVYKKYITLVAG